ncbi:hypothetical protein WJX74_003001 [Apatococcus lobatus]|uniref:Uncharacterized protein n=2 Tax=Apatococcus TaxID=904362 RepID=A0AAW1T2I6_9CHLO
MPSRPRGTGFDLLHLGRRSPQGQLIQGYPKQRRCRRRSDFGVIRATDSAKPEDIVQDCLTLLRKEHTEGLQEHLACPPHAEAPSIRIGNDFIREQGPLAYAAGVLDVGARRVLPGHLLRRSQVLSLLQIAPDKYLERVSVTASSGEWAVLAWTLQRLSGRWTVSSVKRDATCNYPLPIRPHPRYAPETVVLAQIAALRKQRLYQAGVFHAAGASQMEMEQQQGSNMEDYIHCVALLQHLHHKAVLGEAALPTRSSFLQEVTLHYEPGVVVEGPAAVVARRTRFIWSLELNEEGCWQVIQYGYCQS